MATFTSGFSDSEMSFIVDAMVMSELHTPSVFSERSNAKWKSSEVRVMVHVFYHFAQMDLNDVAFIAQSCGVRRSTMSICKKAHRIIDFGTWKSLDYQAKRDLLRTISNRPGMSLTTDEMVSVVAACVRFGALTRL